MSEPTVPNYPSSYEDDSTLLAPLVDRAVGTLKSAVSVADLQCTLNEDFQGFQGDPCLIVFEGGEIWFVEEGDISFASEETTITLSSFALRGWHNSPVQPHTAGEKVYFALSHTHVNMLRKGIEVMQQNGFIVGTEAQKSVYESSAVAAEGWLATDSGKIYYCFSAGTFTWVNKSSHQELDGRGDDDHDTGANAYHNTARANTWHSGLGTSHILSGDDHDHYTTNEGAAVVRVDGGVDVSKGSPAFTGHVYFSTDIDGGTLFISSDGADWDKISGAPAGAIAMFPGACPSNWTRYTNLDAKYFKLDSVSPGGTGGALTHNHDLVEFIEHYHTVAAIDATNISNPGSHSHPVKVHTGSGGLSRRFKSGVYTGTIGTTQSGSHTHNFTLASQDVDQAGAASPTTSTDNQEPPYQEIVFCEKD